MSSALFAQYSKYEDQLRKQFHQHPIYRGFSNWSPEQFYCYLLQVGFIAQNFVKWYETAKLGLTSEAAREVVRHILWDEIPVDMPTHQDQRQYDLQLVGISPIRALNTRPTRKTRATIKRLYKLIAFPQNDHDLRVMITLRMAGEVLVAEQYRHIVRFMKVRLGIDPKQSRFFVPHYLHDLKGKQAAEGGHTDAFDILLADMITDERQLAVAMDAAKAAYKARVGINDQFLVSYRSGKWVGRAIAAAAGMTVAVMTSGIMLDADATRERANWQATLLAMDVTTREFYLGCDRDLLGFAAGNGAQVSEFLSKVGTMHACAEIYVDPATRE